MCVFLQLFPLSAILVGKLATNFVRIADKSYIRTLRARIHTSVGRTTNVVPTEHFLKVVEKEVEAAAQSKTSSCP